MTDTKISAFTNSANFSAAKSLSTTASTPFKVFKTLVRTTGIPPPPTAITIAPDSTSVTISRLSTISTGAGEATTRRYPRPESSAISQPLVFVSLIASRDV